MKILGIIPARYHSTRLPGKPLLLINGKPMIQHVYERVKQSNVVDKLIIATDDERIKTACELFGAEVILTSAAHKSGTDRCAEVATLFEKDFEVVINIQGDEPFISTEHLQTLKILFLNQEVQIGSLVKKINSVDELKNKNVVKAVKSIDGRAMYFSRSVIPHMQNCDSTDWEYAQSYYKHIGLYGYRTDVLLKIAALSSTPLEQAESLEQLRWLENNFTVHLAETFVETLSIDTADDLMKANEGGSLIN